jgi:uncharacterized protein
MKLLVSIVLLAVVSNLTTSRTELQKAADDLVPAANNFVDLLVQKNFAAAVAQYDDTMKAALPQAKLEEVWTTVQLQAGAYKSRGKTRTQKQGNYSIVFVTCEFEKTSLDIKVVFDSANRVAGLFFTPATSTQYSAPSYVKADAFHENNVTVGDDQWALPGTLTLPNGQGPFPAVVLVHGSGPQDRDETIGPNKPFKDLAWGLASKGIAVLRFEKRTKQHAGKLTAVKRFTVKEEVIDDALAAVALLRKTEAIDRHRIFVLGHSLGGMLVPRIASRDSSIAGIISLAGATRALETVIPEQLHYIFSLDGSISPEEQKKLDEARQQAAKVKALTPKDLDSTDVIFGAPASYWLDLRGYDPPATAHELKQPILILQGERDYQVTMQDFGAWRTALGARDNATFKSYPGLNHLFIVGTGKSGPTDYDSPGHIDEHVIADIATWILNVR